MTNALMGSYNVGVPGLSTKVNKQIGRFYRDDKVKAIFGEMNPGVGPTILADRYNEEKFVFNHDCTWLPDVKYEYKKVGTFEEVCMESAQILADKGKTIDFYWSGGIDSTTALVSLMEICPKQLHIICSPTVINEEYPEYWNKVVKHLDHTVDDKDNVLGVGNPQKNVFCQCTEADTLFGTCMIDHDCGHMTPEEIAMAEKEWLVKFRYVLPHRGWRTLFMFDGDWFDVDNWGPFYASRSMQQYAVNQHMAGEIHWYSFFLFGNDMPDYVNAKMPQRDLIYKYTKDKEFAYGKLKYGSLSPAQKSIRNVLRGQKDRNMTPDQQKQFKASGNMPKAWGFTNTGIVINERTCKDIDIESYLLPENKFLDVSADTMWKGIEI